MTKALPAPRLKSHRIQREIIAYAERFYLRFWVSLRDVEKLLTDQGVTVSYDDPRLGQQVQHANCRDDPPGSAVASRHAAT